MFQTVMNILVLDLCFLHECAARVHKVKPWRFGKSVLIRLVRRAESVCNAVFSAPSFHCFPDVFFGIVAEDFLKCKNLRRCPSNLNEKVVQN